MRFTWDERKKNANPRKHRGITFELAQEVFDDPHHVVLENYFMADEKEQRAQAIGHEPKSASAFGDFRGPLKPRRTRSSNYFSEKGECVLAKHLRRPVPLSG
jgi:uncharacterized DUF497 family protein